MKIVWNEHKWQMNLAKHGFDFADLTDDFFLTAVIEWANHGRWKAIGEHNGEIIIAVVFRLRGPEMVAVISMRLASGKERRAYGTEQRSIRALTDAEEAQIQRKIASDPDNPEWTGEQLADARPFAEVFPELAASIMRGPEPGRKQRKEVVTLCLDPDVVAAFKAEGPGWRSRVNGALRKAKKLPDRP